MSVQTLPQGLYPELPVPFEEDGAVDWFGYGRVLERCLGGACGGVLVGGRLSESRTLREQELRGLVGDAALACGKNRAAICALQVEKGPAALEEAAAAEDAGARALLLEAGKGVALSSLFRFARALQKDCRLPLLLPLRGCEKRSSGVRETAAAAAESGVFGLCDESGALYGRLLLKDAAANAGLYLAGRGGEALFAQPLLSFDLIFSPLAACFPRHAAELFAGRTDGRIARLYREMLTFSMLFEGKNAPAAVKWILFRQGICAPHVRLPLSPPDRAERALLDALLARAG